MNFHPRPLHVIALLPAALALWAATAEPAKTGPAWTFTVSGDSRDCGDVVMPKIAAAIAARRQEAPADFFWHLGDFRRATDVDCDMLLPRYPDASCENRGHNKLPPDAMSRYLDSAWDDFVEKQVQPFGDLPVFLGIGNHETWAFSHDDFKKRFRKWLTRSPIQETVASDYRSGIRGVVGDTTYRFFWKGVDFIYLDNADKATAFRPEQVRWLQKVLASDEKNEGVKSIVVGMHASLPYSKARWHAMDERCQGFCSGNQVYAMLNAAQAKKRVYLLASHAHTYIENLYDTPEHRGQVIPGWLIGSAGAQQYVSPLRYGYLEIEVRGDGELRGAFREVTRESPPAVSGPGAAELTQYCFEKNFSAFKPSEPEETDCACGALAR